ncbi:hypothetical protein F0L68_33565 [Solihabitans fulvus]|uniref:Uncharacterized protein n=1 Tax=Solihabitans fulvus TaxID=1892852 RepID=A0A5B2WQT8_9PSEU|nr:hypothetical protein [Solihabitans fulvus]KAA2253338.1 hypothetical protein F0L68_33565 [Solihabitans fulvus]
MSDSKTERQAVAEIFAQQDEVVRDVIKEVLTIERSRLHLRQQDKGTIDLLTNAMRRIVE